jgi:hypothetical protein
MVSLIYYCSGRVGSSTSYPQVHIFMIRFARVMLLAKIMVDMARLIGP